MGTTDEIPTNPFTTVTFVIAATGLAVVVLMGAVFSAVFLTQSPDAVDAATPACERPAHQDTIYGAITVDSYHPYGSAAVPVTPYGPSNTRTAPSCYEHSPAGAAAAAAAIATLTTSGRPELALDHLTAPSPNADAVRQDTADTPVPDPVPTVAGTRIQDYDGDTATVRVALEADTGTIGTPMAALDVHLVWDGDWKWDLPTRSVTVEKVYGLNGYNRFETPQEDPTNV